MLPRHIDRAAPDRRAPWRRAVLMAVLVALVGAACGSSSEEPAAGPSEERSTPEPLPDAANITNVVPADSIPAIDEPKFDVASDVTWLEPKEPVIVMKVGDEAKAYPLQIMTWHEIVNDEVGGVPLAVTFCPLCNTAIAYERVVDGEVTTFGTSGSLLNSNLVMYDRATESMWPQATGIAVSGAMTGEELTRYPAQITSWEEFESAFPDAPVLNRDTGHSRDYGRNPYPGYDDVNVPPFLFSGETDGRLAAVERVLGFQHGGEALAFPYLTLEDISSQGATAATFEVKGDRFVVLWKKGARSALDAADITSARDVGQAVIFSADLDGETLELEATEGSFVDPATGSEFNIFGEAISGPLEGESLTAADSFDTFWFDWAAFHPDTEVWKP